LSEQWIVTNAEGDSLEYREGKKYPAQPQYALCRCGQSANKPFCDGTHSKVKFDGTETASHQPYLKQAETIEGPTMLLTDQENLCAFARFCDPKGKSGIWSRKTVPNRRNWQYTRPPIVPPGGLVVWDKKTGKAIEPKFEPSLGLIEDTEKKVGGPIWGGAAAFPVVSADGKTYEIRKPADFVPMRQFSQQTVLRRLARGLNLKRPADFISAGKFFGASVAGFSPSGFHWNLPKTFFHL